MPIFPTTIPTGEPHFALVANDAELLFKLILGKEQAEKISYHQIQTTADIAEKLISPEEIINLISPFIDKTKPSVFRLTVWSPMKTQELNSAAGMWQHANLVYFDPEKKKIYVFDPYYNEINSSGNKIIFNSAIKIQLENSFPDFKVEEIEINLQQKGEFICEYNVLKVAEYILHNRISSLSKLQVAEDFPKDMAMLQKQPINNNDLISLRRPLVNEVIQQLQQKYECPQNLRVIANIFCEALTDNDIPYLEKCYVWLYNNKSCYNQTGKDLIKKTIDEIVLSQEAIVNNKGELSSSLSSSKPSLNTEAISNKKNSISANIKQYINTLLLKEPINDNEKHRSKISNTP